MPVIETTEASIDFAALLVELHRQGYTGAIILNFRNGVPMVAEYSRVQIRLERVSGLDKSRAVSAL